MYMTTDKTIALKIQIYVSKLMSLLFKTLFRFDTAIFPRSKCLLISWLQSPSFGAQENEIWHCFHIFPIYLSWSDRTRCMILGFWMLSLKPAFHSPLSHSSRGSLVPLHFLPLKYTIVNVPYVWNTLYLSYESLKASLKSVKLIPSNLSQGQNKIKHFLKKYSNTM